MPAQPVGQTPTRLPLSEHLQHVTEAMAAARTPEEVFNVVLQPALTALNAVAGAVLLVNEAGDRLEIAALQGDEAGAQAVWQDGPLDGKVPAGDALKRHEALYFEHQGDLTRAYPELEARTGGVAAVATAVLPMFLDDRPLGTLILDFRDPHTFTAEERQFLRTLAAQCALALGRARLLESVRHEARQKTDILESISDAFYAVDHHWRFTYVNRQAEQWWGRRREELLGRVYWEEFPQAVGSAPYHAHLRAMRERQVVRLESKSPILGHWVDISIYPTEDGVSVYFKDISERKRQEEELRGLNADLEARVEERTRRIEEDARAQEAFVAFTEAVGTETDVLALTRQAIAVLRARFPDGSAAYYEPDGELWKARAWSDDIREDLLALLTAGLPETPLIREVLTRRDTVFVDAWDAAREEVERSEDYGTGANTPLIVNGEVRGILALALREARRWAPRDQALFRAVGRGLNLALERAEGTRRLERQNAELDARNRALEAFEALGRDFSLVTDPDALICRAQELLYALLSLDAALHYEREGDHWYVRSLLGGYGNEELKRAHEAGLPHDQTGNLRVPFETGETYYQHEYDPDVDHLNEHMEHVTATAMVPLGTAQGTVRGIIGLGRFGRSGWSETDRTIIETARQSLELALDRADKSAALAARTREAETARVRAEVLASLGDALQRAATSEEMADLALDTLGPALGAQSMLVVRVDGEGIRLPTLWGNTPEVITTYMTRPGLRLSETPILRRAAETGRGVYLDDYHAEPGTVSSFPSLAGGVEPIHLPDGTLEGFVVVWRGPALGPWQDTERDLLRRAAGTLGLGLERAEVTGQLVAQRQTLEAANEELEAFTYSVSHDLRTPVRHVMSFNHLLRKSLGEDLDAKATRYLGVVEEAAGRMNTLIDAMLDLSRTSRLPLRVGPVDLGGLVHTVRSELEAEAPERAVEWQVAPLPLVEADPDTLRQVVVNLLSNALKYTRTRETARIEVCAEERLQEWVVFVRDNGVGFDPRYGNKLFGVFQRLHRSEDFEGTGVGLANVRRIIARHGGRVWAEGRPGEGATFGFTLPRG